MRSKIWTCVGLGVMALVVVILVSAPGRDPVREVAAQTGDAGAVKKVVVTTPEWKSLTRIVEQPGTIQAYEETHLFARVSGYVSKVPVDIGRKIQGPRVDAAGKETELGQVLAEIAVPDLEEETNQKRAVTRQMEAEVEQARKALASADVNILAMEAATIEARALYERWESESKRITSLAKNGVIDAQTRDEVNQQYKAAGGRIATADAAVRKARADRDKAEADVATAASKVDVARAEVRRLEASLAFAKIRAPYDGIVVSRSVSTGDFVHPAGRKGEALFLVSRVDPVRIVIDVPEADAALVQDGQTQAKLNIKPLRITGLAATITRTSWALKPGARTLRAEIELPNKDGTLRPGMYVYAHIQGQWPKCWTLPTSAVVKQGDTMVCFRVEGNKAVRTPVQVGRSDGSFVEVFNVTGKEEVAAKASGLSDGDAVER